jgi:hypothetical protein
LFGTKNSGIEKAKLSESISVEIQSIAIRSDQAANPVGYEGNSRDCAGNPAHYGSFCGGQSGPFRDWPVINALSL